MRSLPRFARPFAAATLLGVGSFLGDPLARPSFGQNVVPIPLQYPGEGEEAVVPPSAKQNQAVEELPAPQPMTASPPFQTDADNIAPPELTGPSKTDPFAQPDFDPFDDEQFRPRTETNIRTKPNDPVEQMLRVPASQGLRKLELPTEASPTDNPMFSDEKHETIRERYPSGAVKIEREMVQDADGSYLLDGSWRWFTEKGQLIADGDYLRDKRQGLWRRTFSAGDAPLFKTAPYDQFQGPFHAEATFAEGVLHGAWTIYDSKQRKISEIYYEDGVRHGPATWWQGRGTPAIQANFVRGEIHGEAYVFDANGKVVRHDRYENGWKYGRRTDKHANGKPKEVSTWLDGHWKLKGDDDFWNARIANFEVVEEPLRHGPQVTYFPNGQMQRKQEFNHGKPVGEVHFWHDNGQRAMAGHFNAEGKPDGDWTWWHANGLRSAEGIYLAGKAQGDWTFWNADGKITRKGEPGGMATESIATSPAGPTTLGRPREVD